MPKILSKQFFAHPFSRVYWQNALAEMKSVRILALAALFIALRIALASFYIPVGDNLKIFFTFFVNALGAMIYGPAVALLSGFISDILGFMIHPSGAFFPGYVLSSMLGSFFYAIFLYRSRVTVLRLFLAKLCVNLFVNIGLGATWSAMLFSKGYYYYLTQSVIKNLTLLPFEVITLALFMQIMLPLTARFGLTPGQPTLRLPLR